MNGLSGFKIEDPKRFGVGVRKFTPCRAKRHRKRMSHRSSHFGSVVHVTSRGESSVHEKESY
jgi:hypothetical protein